MLVFEERGKLEFPEKKYSEQSREPTKLSPHMAPGPGIEPGTHWWKASSLNTAPTLLPRAIPAPPDILFLIVCCYTRNSV